MSYVQSARLGLFAPVFFGVLAAAQLGSGAGELVVPLPPGVRAVWDMGAANRETTATRERVCLNGLWQWQPAGAGSEQVPAGNWGWFKVPGCWPGITDYLQKDCQTIFAHPAWMRQNPGEITTGRMEQPPDNACGGVFEFVCGGMAGWPQGR